MKLELLKLCDYLYMTTSVGLLPYYVIIKFYSILSYWDITFNYLFPAHVVKHGGVFCYQWAIKKVGISPTVVCYLLRLLYFVPFLGPRLLPVGTYFDGILIISLKLSS